MKKYETVENGNVLKQTAKLFGFGGSVFEGTQLFSTRKIRVENPVFTVSENGTAFIDGVGPVEVTLAVTQSLQEAIAICKGPSETRLSVEVWEQGRMGSRGVPIALSCYE